MKVYSFWSADTTYFTKSKNLQNAKKLGRENYKSYLETCKYLGENPEADKSYFIPEALEEETVEWFNYMVKNNHDILILDDELYDLITE